MDKDKKTDKPASGDKTAVKKGAEQEMRFKGKYISATGRRKTSVARIRLYKKGNGVVIVNGRKIGEYFDATMAAIARQPLKQAGHARDVDISVVVSGGGGKGQAEAVRHGIARILVEIDKDLRPAMKANGWLKRDARKKERKKPGLKKARRAPQWSKR